MGQQDLQCQALTMSSSWNQDRLIDNMGSDRSKMLTLIIRSFVTPHCEGYLDPQTGKASQRVVVSFAFISFPTIVLLSPLAFLKTGVCKLMKCISSELVASHSEADIDTLSRTSCIRNCSIERTHFVVRTELIAIIKNQQLSSQYIVCSRKGSENITMGYLTHYLLNSLFVVLYLLDQKNKVS